MIVFFTNNKNVINMTEKEINAVTNSKCTGNHVLEVERQTL